MDFLQLCAPALIYFAFSITAFMFGIMSQQHSPIALIIKLLVCLVGTWLINNACSRGYQGPSWFSITTIIVAMISILVIGAVIRRNSH